MSQIARAGMRRFSITQLLMTIVLAAIVLMYLQSEGTGQAHARIETLDFTADGSELLVAKLTGRSAQAILVRYMDNVVRTISRVSVSDGATTRVVNRDSNTGIRDGIPELAISPNGKLVAVGFDDGWLEMYDTSTGKRRWRVNPAGRHGWPWTVPATLFTVWICVAIFLFWPSRKNQETKVKNELT